MFSFRSFYFYFVLYLLILFICLLYYHSLFQLLLRLRLEYHHSSTRYSTRPIAIPKPPSFEWCSFSTSSNHHSFTISVTSPGPRTTPRQLYPGSRWSWYLSFVIFPCTLPHHVLQTRLALSNTRNVPPSIPYQKQKPTCLDRRPSNPDLQKSPPLSKSLSLLESMR